MDTLIAERLYQHWSRMLRQLRRLDLASGLGPSQHSALSCLSRQSGPISISALAIDEGVARPTMSRIVSALQEIGAVTCQLSPSDKRQILVVVSDHGRCLYDASRERRTRVIQQLLGKLPAGVVEQLATAVEDVATSNKT